MGIITQNGPSNGWSTLRFTHLLSKNDGPEFEFVLWFFSFVCSNLNGNRRTGVCQVVLRPLVQQLPRSMDGDAPARCSVMVWLGDPKVLPDAATRPWHHCLALSNLRRYTYFKNIHIRLICVLYKKTYIYVLYVYIYDASPIP